MTNPIYYLEIKAFHCYVELWLNDIIVFAHYEKNGSIWVDWPVNQFILESGMQSYEVRLLPYDGETKLAEQAEAEFGIHAIEAITENERIEIIEKASVDIQNNNNLPLFVKKGSFPATVPYKNDGWKNSVSLANEDEKKLLNEVLTWNEKLLNIYKTSDIVEYNKIYLQRETEYANAYNIPLVQNSQNIFHSKFKDLESLENDLYQIGIYGNGKLVSLKLPQELPGFTYQPVSKDEESLGVSLLLFFHRKSEGEALEVIR